MSEEKEEYCIWNENIGRMDSSTNWKDLYELGNRNIKRLDGSFSIVPTRLVGKGRFRTFSQKSDDRKREHQEFMKKHNEWKKKHNM